MVHHLVREARVVFQHVHQAEMGVQHQRGHQRRLRLRPRPPPAPPAPPAPLDALAGSGFHSGRGSTVATTHDRGGSGRSLEEVVEAGGRVELPEMKVLGLPVVSLVVGADDADLTRKAKIENELST